MSLSLLAFVLLDSKNRTIMFGYIILLSNLIYALGDAGGGGEGGLPPSPISPIEFMSSPTAIPVFKKDIWAPGSMTCAGG